MTAAAVAALKNTMSEVERAREDAQRSSEKQPKGHKEKAEQQLAQEEESLVMRRREAKEKFEAKRYQQVRRANLDEGAAIQGQSEGTKRFKA